MSKVILLCIILGVSFACVLKFWPNGEEEYSIPQIEETGNWEGAYVMEFAEIEDLPELKSRGVKQILQEIGHETENWQRYYQAIVAHDLQLIPMLWGDDQTAWKWNDENNEWELDAEKYPDSVGARFLKFLLDYPVFLKHTFAIYSFHEPLNTENRILVSSEKQKKFWLQIHQDLFPKGNLKIFGESVSWHEDCKNGCVDYDSIDLYPFAQLNDVANYRLSVIFKKGKVGLRVYTQFATTNRERALANSLKRIDKCYETVEKAAPAPDGSRTKYIPMIQTFAIGTYPKLWNRMPTANEMSDWALKVVGARMNKVAGMGWYSFRPAADYYTHSLHKNRVDSLGNDRWQVINDVAALLIAKDEH